MLLYSVRGFSLEELVFSEKAEEAPWYKELWLTAGIDIPFFSSCSALEKQNTQSMGKAISHLHFSQLCEVFGYGYH